jgi:hypothetical protein
VARRKQLKEKSLAMCDEFPREEALERINRLVKQDLDLGEFRASWQEGPAQARGASDQAPMSRNIADHCTFH